MECPTITEAAVTESGGQDPPLLGCAATNAPNDLTVSITNNRGYSTVVQAPPDATLEPPANHGFEDYVHNQQTITKTLGGTYLAPTATLSYVIPQYGGVDVFRSRPSWKTYVLDLSIPVADGLFNVVTAGYATCIFDNVTTTAPSAADAPSLIGECIPVLAQGIAAWKFLKQYILPLVNFVGSTLAAYDLVHDSILRIHGKVQIGRKTAPQAEVCPKAGPGVPVGLASAVEQQIGKLCGLEINNLKTDPNDPSWVLFAISPTPGSLTQGGGGIAHEVNGAWPVLLTGSAFFWCSPQVPSSVVTAFGLKCP